VLSVAIWSSKKSIGASGIARSCCWWSRTSPLSARSQRGILLRRRPRASSAMVAGSARPSTKAAKIARLDTPITSLTTEASVLLARSQTPWTRLTSRARSCTHCVR